MKLEYDPQADALYIQFREGEVEDTLEVGRHIFVDVDRAVSYTHLTLPTIYSV